ncbi:hypothetical protein FRACYDRAFT_239642 [Fragilariopsis cylindrus CCMP1102]|uniref:Uncharacterized protein n=1 Tax=Fragilariopsis cylindrus CCMP1102 TaxID=635003 RepID=A0A1E7FFU5_9STRA|nr:hypothetical protein FRACYDRAFT_239642 [Fragilariopsis cylindrus CCMP1102]|eukprot:OEU17041.1 hypothetical protein FRACYDRAFT_239642 [Fragilariopsis cylindrus CCMP1102]
MTTSKPDEEQDIETGGEAPATAVKRRKKKKQSATSDGEGRPSAITMDEEGALTPTQGTTTPPKITPQDTRTITTNNSGLSIDQQTILTMMTQISTQYKNMEKDRIVREENGINQMRLPLVGMMVSSMVLLLAVLSWKGLPMWKSAVWRSYAIAYPCVTLVISLMGVLKMCNKEFYLSNGKFIHVLLFLWNFVGACLLTFLNPFTQTGNGYFAAWGTVIFAAGALGIRGIGCNNCVTIVT